MNNTTLSNSRKAKIMEGRLLLPSVFRTTLDQILQQLTTCQKRARARTLTEQEVAEFFEDDVVLLLNEMFRLEISLRHLYGRLDGGAVSMSYGRSADTTKIEIDGANIQVFRAHARSVSGGDAGRCVVGLKGIDNEAKTRLKVLGWTGAGSCWRPA